MHCPSSLTPLQQPSSAARHVSTYCSRLLGGCWLISLPSLAEPTHLLGFVETLCEQRQHCFQLQVKTEYLGAADERIEVRFDSDTLIFDPENYELSLLRQNIVPGSHLRLLIERLPGDDNSGYRASYSWIGD